MPLDRAKVSEEAWAASDGGGPMVVTANRACGEPESQALRLSGSQALFLLGSERTGPEDVMCASWRGRRV